MKYVLKSGDGGGKEVALGLVGLRYIEVFYGWDVDLGLGGRCQVVL